MKKTKRGLLIVLMLIIIILLVKFEFIGVKTVTLKNDGIETKVTAVKLFFAVYAKAKVTNKSTESYIYRGSSSCDTHPVDIYIENSEGFYFYEFSSPMKVATCKTIITETEVNPNQ